MAATADGGERPDFAWLREWVMGGGDGGVCAVREAHFDATDAAGAEFRIRGLAATRDITLGDTVLRVPARCFFCAPTALEIVPPLHRFIESLRRFEAPASSSARPAAASSSSSDSESDAELSEHDRARKAAFLARRERTVAAAAEDKARRAHTEYVRFCADDHEFILAAALVLLRFHPAWCTDEDKDGAGGDDGARRTAFRRFVSTLPAPEEQTNVDFWSDAEAAALGSAARVAKHRRRVHEKLPARFAELDAKVFALNRDLFPPDVFTAGRWWWAIHTLGSRCFNYEPRRCEMASVSDGKNRRRRNRQMGGPHARRRRRAAADAATALGGNTRLAAVLEAADAADDSSSTSEAATTSGDDDTDDSTVETDSAASDADTDDASSSESDSDDTATDEEEEERETFTMVPLADLCNHDDEREACDFEYDPAADALTFVATKAIEAGSQVLIRYNGMDAWKFAKYYGFVPPFHKKNADCYPIDVPPLPAGEFDNVGDARRIDHHTLQAVASDIALATKRQLFSAQGGGEQLLRHCHVTAKGPNPKLLGVMRLRYMSRDEMSDYPRAFLPPPLSTKNELAVHAKLAEIIEAALGEIRAFEASSTEAPVETARGSVAASMRARDAQVLSAALDSCKARANECAELMYYGTTKAVVARRAVLEEQLAALRRQQGGPCGPGGSGTKALHRERPADATVDAEARKALRDVAPAWRHRAAKD